MFARPPGAASRARENPLRCPSCGAELLDVERHNVRVDACLKCHGIWLDRDELQKILEYEGFGSGAAPQRYAAGDGGGRSFLGDLLLFGLFDDIFS